MKTKTKQNQMMIKRMVNNMSSFCASICLRLKIIPRNLFCDLVRIKFALWLPFSVLEQSKVLVGKKVSKKRSKQNVITTGNISFISFFFNLIFLHVESEDESDPPSKKTSFAIPAIVSNRPNRACKQKIIDYRV